MGWIQWFCMFFWCYFAANLVVCIAVLFCNHIFFQCFFIIWFWLLNISALEEFLDNLSLMVWVGFLIICVRWFCEVKWRCITRYHLVFYCWKIFLSSNHCKRLVIIAKGFLKLPNLHMLIKQKSPFSESWLSWLLANC